MTSIDSTSSDDVRDLTILRLQLLIEKEFGSLTDVPVLRNLRIPSTTLRAYGTNTINLFKQHGFIVRQGKLVFKDHYKRANVYTYRLTEDAVAIIGCLKSL